MGRKWRIGPGVAAVMVVAASCGDEAPTAVGSELLGEGLRTVAVVVDALAFMQGDTTYDRIGSLHEVQYGVVAADFEGELDAHMLFQVVRPYRVSYDDTAGNARTDSLDAIRGGTLTVVLDSLSEAEGPIDLAILELTEDWHRNSVSWTLRVDTADVSEAWSTPGGATGAVMATGTWEAGDTLEIVIDSAMAAVWHDTVGARRGGALQVVTPGKRLRIQSLNFRFDVVPEGMDTVLAAGSVARRVNIASPDSDPEAGVLRIGGLPVWRSLIHFLPLTELPVPCESGSTTCTIPLSDVTVNTANLVLRTRATGGRRPEQPLRIDGRAVLEGPGVPLNRSPLSPRFGQMAEGVPISAFMAPAGAEVRVPITGYVRRNVAPPEGEDPLLWLALIVDAERGTFGYGEFGAFGSAAPPQLELVVSIPVRKVAP